LKPGIADALRLAYRMEGRARDELRQAAERHPDDHEIHHVAGDLARWSTEHITRIVDTAERLGIDVEAPIDDPEVLACLRRIYLTTAQASLAWEELAQAAQAGRNDELISLAASCHPQTLRQMRWANTMLKTLAPQILTSLERESAEG
jgi:hypothetical protein